MTTTTTTDVTSVVAGRALIDECDAELLRLLAARRAISQQIQRLRREAGGPRIEHARENEIIRRYAAELGQPGPALALAVLDYCRGPGR